MIFFFEMWKGGYCSTTWLGILCSVLVQEILLFIYISYCILHTAYCILHTVALL